jgi:hypothetical protein
MGQRQTGKWINLTRKSTPDALLHHSDQGTLTRWRWRMAEEKLAALIQETRRRT